MIAAPQRRTSAGSFRDPAGYVFEEDGIYKRAITKFGEPDFIRFIESGLYSRLVRDRLIVAHEEDAVPSDAPDVRRIIVPEQVRHISYPYEWSFGQLRDASLLTLEIERIALEYGMSLKDGSAFNVQFRGPHPVFIDTLSFHENDSGPWPAYSQFCRHFLAPLLLMGRVAPAFNQFLRGSLDGIPLDLASTLLPRSTYLRFGILIHIHLHARSQKRYANGSPRHGTAPVRLTRDPKPGFVDSLQALVRNLAPGRFHTEWMNYYRDASHYSSQAECSKKRAVETVLERTRPSLVYDIGGNTGEYSRLATARAIDCVCYDIDPMCVHHNYERARAENDTHMLPLLMDFSNPSPSLGFDLRERTSFIERSRGDLVLALALIHHLRITANAPFEMIARFLARLGRQLLIEFVPKHDIKAQVLLQSRPDTFQDYTENGFRTSFERHFEFQDSFPIADTARTLYLLRVKS